MKVKQLIEELNLEIVVQGNLEKEFRDCYICDLLSLVMARLKEGDVWITVQTNLNVVAVAALSDCACVIIPEGIPIEQPTIEKARTQEVTLLRTEQTSFDMAQQVAKRLN